MTMTDLSKTKALFEMAIEDFDKMLSDVSVDLPAGMAQCGYVIGIASAYIRALEKALDEKTGSA